MTDKFKHVFERIENFAGLIDHPKLILRLNSEFKEMGIKKVTKNPLSDTTYESKITLYIRPTYRNLNNRYISYSENMGLYNHFTALSNSFGASGFYQVLDDTKIPIKVMVNNNSFEIGCYLKERNVLVLYINPFNSNLSLELENKFLFYFIDALKEYIKNNPLETVDVRKKRKEILVSVFVNDLKNSIRENKEDIEQSQRNIQNYNQRVISNHKLIIRNTALIESYQTLILNAQNIILKQTKSIKELPFVKSVKMSVNGITVDVGMISIKFQNKEIPIGEFLVHLLPSEIKIENKTPMDREGSMVHHPHVNNMSNICFGNRNEKVYELLSKFELKKLIYFIYLFLKSYNSHDRMNPIELWANKAGIKLEKETGNHELNAETEPLTEEESDDGEN